VYNCKVCNWTTVIGTNDYSEMQKYLETPSVSPHQSTSSDQSSESQEPAPKKMKLFRFMDSPSQSCQPDQADLSLTMCQEHTNYFRTTVLDYDNDPLAWWKSHVSDFPHVARTAKTVLSISAPIERIFSKASKIFRPERTRLTTEKLEQLVFIKCNKRIC